MSIREHKLANGMTVILEENHNAPVISYNILVKVGSASETDREAGMCHFIEHMLFKGTPTRKVGEIARDIEAAGGEINAYTSFDQTVFYVSMASHFAEQGLSILADAIKNSLFDPKELEREREVILEEMRRDKDSPMHLSSERLFSISFTKHNYGRPIVGFVKTVKSFSRSDMLQFYRKWYTPHNMATIVVGDFDSDKMLEKIDRAFSNFRGHLPPKFLQKHEPKQKGFKIEILTKNIQTTYFTMGFHIPEITNPEVPALDILSHILAGAESSRLEQIVKEQKGLVHQIYSHSYTPKDPGIFLIGGIMQTKNTSAALDAIWKEIFRFHYEKVPEDEIKRAKTNIRSNQIYEKETVGGEAGKIAYFLATANTHEYEGRYYQILRDVRSDDVQKTAQEYLTPSKCTLVLVNPLKEKEKIKPSKIKEVCFKHLSVSKKRVKKLKKDLSPVIEKLPNGIRLLIRENHSLPIVTISTVGLGGVRFETRKNNGINSLIARTVTKGTKRRSAEEIVQEIESIAGRIDGAAGRNSIGVFSEFLSDQTEKGFEILGDVLSNPSFSNQEVSKERLHQIEAIENQEDALATLAFINFQKNIFKKHPYGMRLLGEIKTVRSITPSTLQKYYHTVMNPANIVISVVGDVLPKQVTEMVQKYICIPRSKYKLPTPPRKEPTPTKIRRVETNKPGKQQAHIVLGFQATKLTSPDHYTMTVLNQILSGQGGRLFVELRDRLSLAYSVSSIYQPGIDPGFFAVYIGTEVKKAPVAIDAIRTELEKVTKKLVSKDEIKRAKEYLIGAHELESQRYSSLSATYAFNLLYGIGVKEIHKYHIRIKEITREDIIRAARKYIDMDAYTLSVVRP